MTSLNRLPKTENQTTVSFFQSRRKCIKRILMVSHGAFRECLLRQGFVTKKKPLQTTNTDGEQHGLAVLAAVLP